MPDVLGKTRNRCLLAVGTDGLSQEPRQFLPPSGQAWTSLGNMQGGYKNCIEQDPVNPKMWSIFTRPQFAIGQRAILLETPTGNVLWDCISFLDQQTIDFIKSRGGLKAIAISHPHFYTSHLAWAEAFDCPVYLAAEDAEWLNTDDPHVKRVFVDSDTQEILPGVTMVKLGGHFPGSSVLHWDNMIVSTQSYIGQNLRAVDMRKPQCGTRETRLLWTVNDALSI